MASYFVIESDASKSAVGAALLQPHLQLNVEKRSSTLHPVAFFSKKLTDTQTRYAAQERELLGIMLALQHWRHWVEGSEVTIITDHESLKSIRSKTEQPARIVRFLDALEHYGVRIIYRQGKANVLADYLSRPPETANVTGEEAHDHLNGTNSPNVPIKRPEELNRIDLQSIFEFLSQGSSLPPRINEQWARTNFIIHQDQLYKFQRNHFKPLGDPPELPGAVSLQVIPDYDTFSMFSLWFTKLKAMQPLERQLAYEAIRTCRSCQLMKPPDPSLPDLKPLSPAPPLTRWGIDHTQIGSKYILNAVEYGTGWLESRFVGSTSFSDTIPLLEFIINTFGAPREIISDNAGCFTGVEARQFKKHNNIRTSLVTPARPRGNGKVEQANGVLKGILTRIFMEFPQTPLNKALARAVQIYNRRTGPTEYSPYFLLFGTQPPELQHTYAAYTRDPTPEEDCACADELAKLHAAPIARSYVASLKAVRAKVRSYLQEKKGLTRVYAPGDWVLRVRQRTNKFEPYYDGPWAIAACHTGNTYSLISPGGFLMANKYNGTNLFPAYVRDGHPVRSLWYGSNRLLESDRSRLRSGAGI
ncbi:hypothetical protein K3495_g3855 [Podosphaera aphanis]|nr:hypothetical protein K3495_g3855 [Podosphaera aphanis]